MFGSEDLAIIEILTLNEIHIFELIILMQKKRQQYWV